MKTRTLFCFFTFSLFILLSCNKGSLDSLDINSDIPIHEFESNLNILASGNTQISGSGTFDDGGCGFDQGALFALDLVGDLSGCWFIYPEDYTCLPNGVYIETGRDHFVGFYNGEQGSFWTTYRFEGKYENCEDFQVEIFGRCQHPIVEGTGTGVFEGVKGRVDFKDEVETGIFYYRGHIK